MAATSRPIRMYGHASELAPPEWASVEALLSAAPLYWVAAASMGWPHPRPVWGVWHEGLLCVSVGSPDLRQAIAADGRVTAHLESGTDVVIVEGLATPVPDAAGAVSRYDAKYDYGYDVSAYGPLLGVAPSTILAWTADGFAGRLGFRTAGAWDFSDTT